MKIEFDRSLVLKELSDLIVGEEYWEVGQGGSQNIIGPLYLGKFNMISYYENGPNRPVAYFSNGARLSILDHNIPDNDYNNWYLTRSEDDALEVVRQMKENWTPKHEESRQEFEEMIAHFFSY